MMTEPNGLNLVEHGSLMVEWMPDPTVICDPKGLMRFVNRQFIDLFGEDAEFWFGRPVEMLVPPSQRTLHESHRGHFLKQPQARPMGEGLSLNAVSASGEIFPVMVSLNPVLQPDGQWVVASIRDLSQQVDMDRRLAHAQAFGRELFDASPLLVFETDVQARIRRVNPAVIRLSHITIEQWRGRSICRLFEPDQQVRQAIEQVRAQGWAEPVNATLRFVPGSASLSGSDDTVSDHPEIRLSTRLHFAPVYEARAELLGFLIWAEAIHREGHLSWLHAQGSHGAVRGSDAEQTVGQANGSSAGASDTAATPVPINLPPDLPDFERMPVPLALVDGFGRLLVSNQAWKSRRPDDGIETSLSRSLAFNPDSLDSVVFWEAIGRGLEEPITTELLCRCLGDHPVWFRVRAVPWGVSVDSKIETVQGAVLLILEEIDSFKQLEYEIRQSEQRHRQLAEFATDMITRHLSDGTIVDCSRASIHNVGYPATAMQGRVIYDFIHPDDVEAVRNAHRETLHHGKPVRSVFRFRCSWGSWAWIESSAQSFEGSHDGPRQLIAVSRDHSQQKSAQEEMSESRRRLAGVLNSVNHAIVAADCLRDGSGAITDYRVMVSNRAADQLLNDNQPSDGRLVSQLSPILSSSDRVGAISSMIQSGRPVLIEFLTYLNEEARWFELSAVKLDDGFATCITDITERKETQFDLRRLNEDITKKSQEMEQFVYAASHDLKSPVVTIMGFLGFLREDIDAGRLDDARAAADRIESAGNQLKRAVDDLLKLSRAGYAPLDLERIEMREFIHQLVRDSADDLADIGVQVSVGEQWPTIQADRARLRQAMENLLGNAMKYGCREPGSRLEIGYRSEQAELLFFVRDYGPGIPEESASTVFEPFERLDDEVEGSGIGLAIVRRAIERHGGRVWVEPTDPDTGRGCTFWISLPGSFEISDGDIATLDGP